MASGGRPPGPGDVVGHYRLDHAIGVGGMGAVHAATDLTLSRRVAVKILSHVSPEHSRRFQREAAVLARLDSPHVVAIYDHGEQDGRPYLVMPLAEGGELGRLLRERGAMPLGLAARACAQIADALADAHDVGVVHRDVKPANVLLRDDRVERLHVYLSDFGVALTESTGLTSPGAIAGTWNYLAPERTRGEPGSPASDIYSVGCLFWECLTGEPPFQGTDVEVAMEHLASAVPQLPGSDEATARANEVLRRTMAKEPSDRYGSARELRDALRAIAGATTAGRATTTSPRGATSGGRRRTGLIAAGAVLALVAAGGVAAAVALGGDDEPGGGGGGASPEGAEPVLSDYDGDGFGDLLWSVFDDTQAMKSTGTAFGQVQTRGLKGFRHLAGDLDGDGRLDLVSVDAAAGGVDAVTDVQGGSSVGNRLDVPTNLDALSLTFVCGDFDGDGADDVGVLVPAGGGITQVYVARSTGDGKLAAAELWYEGPVDPAYASVALGDFDGDGDDDLVSATTNGRVDSLATLLVSDGEAFAPAGGPVPLPDEVDGEPAYTDDIAGADVDGDGDDELVLHNSYTAVVVVVEPHDALGVGELWSRGVSDRADPSPAEGGANLDGVFSDVDGDGDADFVTVGGEGVKVLLSDGTGSLTYEPAWDRVVKPFRYDELTDGVVLGSYS